MRCDFPFSLDKLSNCSIDEKQLEKYRVEKVDFKYSLGIGLTSKCNLSCPFCYYHSKHTLNPSYFDLALFSKIIEDLPFLNMVTFSLEGEGFCHPNFLEFIKIASLKSKQIEITTNGLLYKMNDIMNLLKFNVSSISLSIDSGDEEQYKFLRFGGNFSRIKDNAKEFVQAFGESVVRLYAVVNNRNLDGLLKLPKLAFQLGVKEIGLGQIRTNSLSIENGIFRAKEVDLINLLNSMNSLCKEYGIRLKLDPFFATPNVMKQILNVRNLSCFPSIYNDYCNLPYFFTSILSSGTLFTCCGDLEPQQIKEYSFDGIFNHRSLLMLRYLLNTKKIPKMCLQCHNLI